MNLLRHNRAFRRLWVAGAISEAGDWLLAVALPVHVFLTTGSAVATSIVFLLGLVPAAVLGPLAGALVDRWDRRRTLVAVAVAQAVFLVPLVVPVAAGQLWVLYVVMFAQTVLAQFSEPARGAFLPEVVEDDDLVAANGLLQTGNSVARLVGAGAGGFVLQLADLTGVGVGDIASFAVSALLLAGVARRPVPAAVATAPSGVLVELRAGFALIRGDRRLRGAIGVFALCGLAQGMFVVLHVVFILDRLGAPTSATGVLRGVQAVGGVLGGLLVTRAGRRWRTERMLAGGLFAMGAISLTTWSLPAVTSVLPAYVVLFVAVGAPAVVFSAALATFVQRVAPPNALGRVFAAGWSVNSLLQGAGTAAAGALVGPLGLYPLLVVQSSVYMGAGLLALRSWSSLAGLGADVSVEPVAAAGLDISEVQSRQNV